MGYMKQMAIQQMEQGWCSVGDKFVCEKCFHDYAIQDFIKSNTSAKQCSYCERSGPDPMAAEMDEVLRFVAEGLQREYEDPANCVGRDKESESGWAIDPDSTYDLFFELGFGNGPPKLFDDLLSAFSDSQWVQKDPYGALPSDGWGYSWEEFSNQVKHTLRFVFFKVKTREEWEPEPEPHEILKSLEQLIGELSLIRELPVGHAIFRARQHDEKTTPVRATEIGTPEATSAIQSRMSPAGIPMFYGANDPQTAISETVQPSSSKAFVTVGRFETVRLLTVLDLTNLPDVPSLFDEDTYPTRMPLIFMKRFVRDVIKPISRDGREHVDYVPTQIVAEYFRHVFHLQTGEQLDGIMYPSSKSKTGGACYTIFCEQEHCCDSVTSPKPPLSFEPEPVLLLTSKETRRI